MLAIEGIWKPTTQQRIFRRLMAAMARPGVVQDLEDVLGDASTARGVLATLVGKEVGLADPHGLLDEADWPLLRVRQVPVDSADYVICDGNQVPQLGPRLGTLESPELSATLLVVVSGQWSMVSREEDAQTADGHRMALVLSGPGIVEQRTLVVEGLHPQWLARRAEWTAAFPLGVDLILADRHRVSCIPRTTRLVVRDQ